MNSGSAASSHDALLPQTLVASTAPAGMPPGANCMPAQPVASSATPIHTPPASSTTIRTVRTIEMPMSDMAHTALCTARSTTSSAVCGFGFS